MDRYLRLLTDSRLGRLLSSIGNVNLLGAGIGAVVGAVGTFATPMLDAPLYLQGIAIGGAMLAGASGLGLVRNFVVAGQARNTLGWTTEDQRELAAFRAGQQADWRLNRLRGAKSRVDELVALYSAGDAATKGIEGKTDAFTGLASLDGSVKETLASVPDDWAHYSAAPENVVWSGLAWHEQVVALLKIRRERLTDLISRLDVSR